MHSSVLLFFLPKVAGPRALALARSGVPSSTGCPIGGRASVVRHWWCKRASREFRCSRQVGEQTGVVGGSSPGRPQAGCREGVGNSSTPPRARAIEVLPARQSAYERVRPVSVRVQVGGIRQDRTNRTMHISMKSEDSVRTAGRFRLSCGCR